MQKNHDMKKRWITLVFTLLMAVTTAMGQVIYLDEDVNNLRQNRDPNELGVIIPLQDKPYDQYDLVPVGEGMLLLLGLGGAYLAAKKKAKK